MPEPKGDKLYVNLSLSASQTRRRLKGFGHGVRKVRSAGRNQAAIIHTATGRHLQELESRFSDVGCSRNASALSEPIENLPNLGQASGMWLREIGILTISDLARIGPVVAYQLVKQRRPGATSHLLWSMAAGLQGIDSRELSDHEKAQLQRQLAAPATSLKDGGHR